MIDERCCYTFSEFKKVTGMGDGAVRTCRDAGLPVRYVGGRGWILGSDWSRFLRGEFKPEKPKKK